MSTRYIPSDWELPEIKQYDPSDDYYVMRNRRTEARIADLFNPDGFTQADMRGGEGRRYLTVERRYLTREIRVKNSRQGRYSG
jgi:hypothetical protein